MRMTRPLYAFVLGLTILSGCGGGASSDGGDPLVSWTVRATSGTGGTITPSSKTVSDGASVTLQVSPDDGYSVAGVTGCGGTFNPGDNTYRIKEVTSTCLVTASFERTTYDITTEPGPNGTITPTTVSLDYEGVADLTVKAEPGYGIASVTGCGGTLVGNTYTTAPISVDCTVKATFDIGYIVGGNLDMLPADNLSIVLANNTDELTLTGNGSFEFRLPVVDGSPYNVTIAKQPGGQRCSVTGGEGIINGAPVTTVQVGSCQYVPPAAPVVTLDYGLKEVQFSWEPVEGATYYRIFENPDGVSGYDVTPIAELQAGVDANAYQHEIALHRRVNARYQVAACTPGGCTRSEEILLADRLVPAVGYIKASNTGTEDWFGYSVAVSGDGNTLAVGAIGENSADAADQNDDSADTVGAVYVFARSENGWSQEAYLKGSYTNIKDEFGNHLALSENGDVLAVGAYKEDSSAAGIDSTGSDNLYDSGAVYVFTRSGTTWSQDAYLKASTPGANDNFGNSVALSDDGFTLAVGSPRRDNVDAIDPAVEYANSGAVYIFTRSDLGVWSEQNYLTASTVDDGDYFGWSVALAGDGQTLAVGARYEKSNATGVNGDQENDSVNNAGAVYVFTTPDGLTWSQQAYIKAFNTDIGDEFGWTVALDADGNTLAVGAPMEDTAAAGVDNRLVNDDALNSGAAYLFVRSDLGAWSEQAYVKPTNFGAEDQFGYSVALSADGNTFAVGAGREKSAATGINGDENDDSLVSAGAAYVFTRSGTLWSQQAYVKPSNSGQEDKFAGGSIVISSGATVSNGGSMALSSDGGTLAVGALREGGSAVGVDFGVTVDNSNDSSPQSGAVYLF